jgi:hypothetical protein
MKKKCISLPILHLLSTNLHLRLSTNSQLISFFLYSVVSWLLVLLFGGLSASLASTSNPITQLPAAYSTSIDAFKGYLIVFLVAASGVGLMGAFIKSIRGV